MFRPSVYKPHQAALDHLPAHFTCIPVRPPRERASAGRVEAITWDPFRSPRRGAARPILGHEKAGYHGAACMGCAPVAAFGSPTPKRTLSMVHYWPVGGAHYRHQRPPALRPPPHALRRGERASGGRRTRPVPRTRNFSAGPPVGALWAQPIRKLRATFAASYAALSLAATFLTVRQMAAALLRPCDHRPRRGSPSASMRPRHPHPRHPRRPTRHMPPLAASGILQEMPRRGRQ